MQRLKAILKCCVLRCLLVQYANCKERFILSTQLSCCRRPCHGNTEHSVSSSHKFVTESCAYRSCSRSPCRWGRRKTCCPTHCAVTTASLTSAQRPSCCWHCPTHTCLQCYSRRRCQSDRHAMCTLDSDLPVGTRNIRSSSDGLKHGNNCYYSLAL